jgi:hypothetical protein
MDSTHSKRSVRVDMDIFVQTGLHEARNADLYDPKGKIDFNGPPSCGRSIYNPTQAAVCVFLLLF